MPDWTDPEWLAGAHAWIAAHVELTGATEQFYVRPWSTVLRVPTTGGDLYFKANAPSLAHEAALVSILATRRPDLVPPLVAADLNRGWLLMTDAGTRMRELVAEERDLSRWLEILPLHAQLQIDAAADVDQMLAAGVPDLRLAGLADAYEQMLADEPRLVEGDPRVAEAVPRVRELCTELAAFGLPETIQHDDFHDGQVFVRDGRYLLLDWGDACVSHPFLSLSVSLEGVLAWGLDDIEGSVDLTPFLGAYLEPFAAAAPGVDLEAAAQIALRLGWVCRAVNGRDVWSGPDETPQRLRMFLDGRP
jgi:hypothetical protein